jgi:hypothetical protein
VTTSIAVIGLLIGTAAAALAQARPAERRLALSVRVTDTLGAKLVNVDVRVSNSEGVTRSSGRTDSTGRFVTPLDARDTVFTVMAQKIGYGRMETEARPRPYDTVDVVFEMERIVALEVVHATAASAHPLTNDYILTATEIAHSDRTILDAYDALRDLRPSMLGDTWRLCPRVRNLWVNGERILLAPNDPVVPGATAEFLARDGRGGTVQRAGPPPFHVSPSSALGVIKPEHIDEMHYVGCWDTSSTNPYRVNALFIWLKPGIEYDRNDGTRVVDSAAARAAKVIP